MKFPRRRAGTAFLFVVFLVVWSLSSGCGGNANASPENVLLAVFTEKLAQLKKHERGSYVAYFAAENGRFAAEQDSLNALIAVINEKYDGLPSEKRMAYENAWREHFQPVIDDIHTRTKSFVTRETSKLTPETMAKITELALKRRALEKDLPRLKLKPRFFEIPETP